MDIFSIPLYYISFSVKDELEHELGNVGFKNINYFEAVNGKKFTNLQELVNNEIISIRTYKDLKTQKINDPVQIYSLGTIGCSLSHYYLWKKCVDEDMDYITIIEDDVDLRKLTNDEIKFIQKCLSKPKSIFISPCIFSYVLKYFNNFYWLIGAHFYIASKEACKVLIKYCFPIDIAIDAYISNIADRKLINLKDKYIYGQKLHISSITPYGTFSPKFLLPSDNFYYIILLIIILFFVINKYFFENESEAKKSI
jgi:GR25 family glycosyltransferase involved in LPS biosynthesis